MICPSCKKAAKVWAEKRPSPEALFEADQLHGPENCPGGSWCDCQHHCL